MIMKKTLYLSAVILMVSSMVSCSDFLDVTPEGNPTTDTYFTNDQQAIDAVAQLYFYTTKNGDAQFGREIYWEQGGANDIVWGRTRGYRTLATREYTGDESPLRDCFGDTYQALAKCNWVVSSLLKKQNSSSLTEIEKRSLGEAYFFRAFYHFYIAYRYGLDTQGVPFCRHEDFPDGYDFSIPPQQATVMDNYKFIIEDLDKAENLLPDFRSYTSDDRGRAHKAAAAAYKAKVYAYWACWDKSQWPNVITEVDKLKKNYGRDLAPSFSVMFSPEFKDFWNSEYIFSIPSTGGNPGGGCELPGVMWENKGWGKYNGWGQNKPSLDIYKEMAKDNVGGVKNERLAWSILEYGDEFNYFGEKKKFASASDVESGFAVFKFQHAFTIGDDPVNAGYVNTSGDWPTVRINFPLIRFADCLLLRAEAYLVAGKNDLAKNDINDIRGRSKLEEIKTCGWKDLYHERRCELAFEFSDHLYDIKRWAKSGAPEIKALAIAEREAQQTVRHYADRGNPESSYTEGVYEDNVLHAKWDEKQMVFPYPSQQVKNSNGKLTQNPGY